MKKRLGNVRGHFHILYTPAVTHATAPAVTARCSVKERLQLPIDWDHIIWPALGWKMNTPVCSAASLTTHVRIS